MTINIPLSKTGKYAGKYHSIIDDIDKDLALLNWTVVHKKTTIYAYRKRYEGKTAYNVHLHRIILERKIGRDLEINEQVDHINGNGLDNRRKNLRVANNQQNSRNQGIRKTNKSGYKGVHFCNTRKKWIARIRIGNGIRKNLGTFDNPELAYEAYCEAVDKYHGKFGNSG